jgi:hypothetical protein
MMTRTSVSLFGLLLSTAGCSAEAPRPPLEVDCSVADAYEFQNIQDFTGDMSGWFFFVDPTPGGMPSTAGGSNVPTLANAPTRCGDAKGMRLQSSGLNFWGSGYGDWQHNYSPAPPGDTFEGLSFWARSERNAEKSFLFGVDDKRTILNAAGAPDDPEVDPCIDDPNGMACLNWIDDKHCKYDDDNSPVARARDNIEPGGDRDGDGCLGPGDVARGTDCRLPPPQELGTAVCYSGGTDSPPSGGVRVPEADECGNQFHTWINTTETWQLYLIPWRDLAQWPCPNRVQDGIRRNEIVKFEIKFKQGMTYDLWLDNIALYRRRPPP